MPPTVEPTKVIYVGESEAWAIDYLVRHTWKDDSLYPVGRDLLIKVIGILKEFEAGSKSPALPLALTERECWCVDFHIRHDLSMGHEAVGKKLLLAVFGLILEFNNERATAGELKRFVLDPQHDRRRPDEP